MSGSKLGIKITDPSSSEYVKLEADHTLVVLVNNRTDPLNGGGDVLTFEVWRTTQSLTFLLGCVRAILNEMLAAKDAPESVLIAKIMLASLETGMSQLQELVRHQNIEEITNDA